MDFDDRVSLLEEFVYRLIELRYKYASEAEQVDLDQLVEIYETLKDMLDE